MGIKLQYNPSTGKVHYTAATGKLQVVDTGGVPGVPCEYCPGFTPSQLSVTFSGVNVNDGCGNCGSASEDTSWSNVLDINQTFVLSQSISNPCSWVYGLSHSTEVIAFESDDSTCDVIDRSTTFTAFTIIVLKTGANSAILRVFLSSPSVQVWNTGSYATFSACVGTGSIPNILPGTDFCLPYNGGSVIISEI